MTTGMDEVLRSEASQELWLRRLIAVVIDFLIIFLPIAALASVAWSFSLIHLVPSLVAGVLLILYTALFESELGYTIGKRVMDIEVVPLDGRSYDLSRALTRNVTKIHGIVLIVDLLAGLLAEGKPNMRFLDGVTRCEVVESKVAQERRDLGLVPPPAGAEEPSGVVVQAEEAPPEPKMPPTVKAPEPEPVKGTMPEPEEEEAAPGIKPPEVPAPEAVEEEEEAPGIKPPEVPTPPEPELLPEDVEEKVKEKEAAPPEVAPPPTPEEEPTPPEAPEPPMPPPEPEALEEIEAPPPAEGGWEEAAPGGWEEAGPPEELEEIASPEEKEKETEKKGDWEEM